MSKHYKPHKVGKNLNWKIGVLEAQAGLDTSIENAKAAAKSKGEIDRELAEKELSKLKAEKLSRKTFHLKKEIRKSLKRAKVFETQKIVKRIKATRKELDSKKDSKESVDAHETTIRRLERELEMIKSIQTDRLCDLAFYKAIKKNNTLRNHESFISLTEPNGTCVDSEDPEAAKLRSNVESRIFGSKPLKDMQAICISDLLNIIAPEQNVERVLPKSKEIKDKTPKRKETESPAENKPADSEKVENELSESDVDADTETDSEEVAAELKKPKNERKRRAAEIESVERKAARSKAEKSKATKAQKERKRAKTQQKNVDYDSDGVPSTSMFMDSLGGYKSSDPEDYEDEAFDKIYGKVKKNRPGQRARKMMWEKIHGNNANHIKAQLEAEKQAAQEAKWRAQQTYGDSGRKPKPTTEKLHPSWEAKRKLKNAAAVPFQGTKISFNDDAGSVDHGGAEKSETLHPSWEAKRRQKEAQAALASVKNTKIVFDSD